MFFKSTFALFLVVLLSCKVQKKEDHFIAPPNKPAVVNSKPDLKDCLPEDTIINKKSSVKYIIQDTSFDVKVKINNKDTLLGFGFDCIAPAGLIPQLYAANKNTICLLHGYGQDFREFIICHLNEKHIEINRYEIALTFDKKSNTVVFRDYDSLSIIYIKNVETGKTKKILLPESLKGRWISSVTLTKQWLHIELQNEKNISLPIN